MSSAIFWFSLKSGVIGEAVAIPKKGVPASLQRRESIPYRLNGENYFLSWYITMKMLLYFTKFLRPATVYFEVPEGDSLWEYDSSLFQLCFPCCYGLQLRLNFKMQLIMTLFCVPWKRFCGVTFDCFILQSCTYPNILKCLNSLQAMDVNFHKSFALSFSWLW